MSSWISQLEAEPMRLVNGRLMLARGCNRLYLTSEGNRKVAPSRLHLVHFPELQVGTKILETIGSLPVLSHLPQRRGRQREGRGMSAREETQLPGADLGSVQLHKGRLLRERMSLCPIKMVWWKLSKNVNLDRESNHDLHIEQPKRSRRAHWSQMIEYLHIA